jgi:hypothetical protein
VVSGWTQGGFRVGSRVISGSAPVNFRVGFGWFPGRLRVISGSAPGNFRVGSGWFPGRLRVVSVCYV